MEVVFDEADFGVRIIVVLAEGGFFTFGNHASQEHGDAHPCLILHEGVGLDGRVRRVLQEMEIHSVVFAIHIGIP